MARSRVIPNLLYGALGLATVATAAYFAIRSIRARRARGEDDPMLSLRRSTREADRVDSQATKKGKRSRRNVEDERESFEADIAAENVNV